MAVAKTLRNLVIYEIDNYARRTFKDIVISAVLPKDVSPDIEPCILADLLEEREDIDAATMLREAYPFIDERIVDNSEIEL